MTQPTANVHTLPDDLLHDKVVVHVVGAGGTGSQLLPRLAQLHKCMLALGHPNGLDVTVWDSDAVAEHNCIRQNFVPVDVGHNKASVMVNRINMAFGVQWHDEPRRFSCEDAPRHNVDFVIGAVDSKSARREIDAYIRESYSTIYWIDAGNESNTGQVIVGQYGRRIADDPMRLPLVTELYPEIIEGEDDDAPSCSARESIFKQGLATNAMAATWVFAWLSEALRHGSISWSGAFFNLAAGKVSSIPVSKEAWDLIRPALPQAAERMAA